MAPVQKVLIVLFTFLNIVVSEETNLDEFLVVSTSQRPNNVQSVANRIKLEFELNKVVTDKLEMILEDRLDRFYKELKTRFEKTDKEIVDLKKSKILLEQQLGVVKNEIDVLKISKILLEKKLEETKKENFKLEEQSEEAKKEISKLKNSKISLETHIQTLQNRVSNNQHECNKNKNQIEELGKNSKKSQILQEQIIGYNLPKDCKEIQKNEFNFSGVYRIKPASSIKSFKVWCDMETREGAWIYFLNRFDGSLDFNLSWTNYKQGFGDPHGEHWLGLENIHHLTGSQAKELLIELIDWDMKKVYINFKRFSIGNEEEGYFLKTLDEHSGDFGREFINHLQAKFSTKDLTRNRTCPITYEGGWWYAKASCYWCLFTGKYHNETSSRSLPRTDSGIQCGTFPGYTYSLKEARMMIR